MSNSILGHQFCVLPPLSIQHNLNNSIQVLHTPFTIRQVIVQDVVRTSRKG